MILSTVYDVWIVLVSYFPLFSQYVQGFSKVLEQVKHSFKNRNVFVYHSLRVSEIIKTIHNTLKRLLRPSMLEMEGNGGGMIGRKMKEMTVIAT